MLKNLWLLIKRGKRRVPSKIVQKIIRIITPVIVIYYLNTALFTTPHDILFRANHVAIFLALVFMLYSTLSKGDNGVSAWDVILILAAISTAVYIQLNADRIVYRWAFSDPIFTLDVFFGIILMLLILEACRRVLGWAMVIVALALITYCFAGPLIPGLFGHRGVSVAKLVELNYLTTGGIYSIPTKVSSVLAFPFIIFGTFLKITGAADFFFDIGVRFAGRTRGGIAKTAVIASAFFGSLSGSAVANAASTGAITIPLMKKAGYPATFAATVETAASAGGVIMPPMMGAVAFVMAEVIGVSYFDVIKVAFIPALIYFAAIFIQVDSESIRRGLTGWKVENLISNKELVISALNYFGPLVWLVYRLYLNFSPARVSVETTLMLLGFTIIRRWKTNNIKVEEILSALEESVKTNIIITTACSAAGIFIGCIALTGLGTKVTTAIVMFGDDTLFLALIVSMLVALFLGMALNITPTYILVASLAGPALVNLDIPIMSVHMFLLYYSAMATVSPPLALTAYTAATIADADPVEVGFKGWRMALTGFVIPFGFIYHPAMVNFSEPFETILAILFVCLAIYSMVAGMDGMLPGFKKVIPRVILTANTVLLLAPSSYLNITGTIIIISFIVFSQLYKKRLTNEEMVVSIDGA